MRTFMVVVVVGVVACGGSTSEVKDGGDASLPVDSGGSNDGTASMDSPADSIAETSTSDGGCAADWSACLGCLMTQCQNELTACNASMPCKNALGPLATCSSMCTLGCDNTFEVTNKVAKDLIDCGANNCTVCEMQLGW